MVPSRRQIEQQVSAVLQRASEASVVGIHLVEQAPPGGYAPAPGGFLSADLAWQQVLAVCLGLGEGRPDAITLLEWSLREDASVRFGCLAPAARADLAGWLLRTAGPAARPILACVAAGRAPRCCRSGWCAS